jgi:hypothetical protein
VQNTKLVNFCIFGERDWQESPLVPVRISLLGIAKPMASFTPSIEFEHVGEFESAFEIGRDVIYLGKG